MHAICMQFQSMEGVMSEESSRETKILNKPGYVYRVTDQGKSRSMRISEGDYVIISVYSNLYSKPRTTILHEMIGTAAKCWQEKHNERLPELQEWKNNTLDYGLLKRIVQLYFQKYGRLRVFRKDQPERSGADWDIQPKM